jgi:hypothetical protein
MSAQGSFELQSQALGALPVVCRFLERMGFRRCSRLTSASAEFQIDCSQLHNDSTSITVHGAYRRADGLESAGQPTSRVCHDHNKDHRPDLKQPLWILTVCADGAVPLACVSGHPKW